MFGEPKDVDGECNACLFIADNYGDGSATMRCQLAPGHEGVHKEEFDREGGTVTVTWVADERKRCSHGCGQWEHDHESHSEDGESLRCPKDADDHEWSDCAFCHPGMDAQTCGACSGTFFYEEGHKRHCPKKPFTCAVCGESGFGNHDWPSGCPKQREIILGSGVADEFAEDL